ncbi:MAG: cytochrome c oxidase subunit 3 [Candidatus Poseidoniia archaeon]|jgi:heme/copper-type cytochrome/quinol oxidase subunit 3|nr:cytochrome c oxidase subunit 3 [Candidatus Poseidoniia archaeon]MDP7665259.1 cytochrome c oxidase subunit 3 [Candidatus Poseidoniia archaeon]|tara:strand:- start:91 stop:858 length:768 start_codon:yes stop_codon:yes gene_type:complete
MFGDVNVDGEVHGSIQPFLSALGIALLLAGLLIWPLLPVGLVLVVYSLWNWISEEVNLWPERSSITTGTYPATVIIIIAEALLFGAFFVFWFWAKWHTLYWDSVQSDFSEEVLAGRSWPLQGVDFNLGFVAFNSLLLFVSAYTANQYLKSTESSWLQATIVLGLLFLLGQGYEYYNLYIEGLDQTSSFGTAFFALTGIHGLHVLIGIVALSILFWLVRSDNLSKTSQLPESIVLYWHFVDVIWVLILLVVYLEVI